MNRMDDVPDVHVESGDNLKVLQLLRSQLDSLILKVQDDSV